MRKARGFTLVELLVVIGIIALLISILMPALSTARRNAQTVKCLSNLRQVGTAFQLYAADFKGAIPVVRQDIPDGVSPAKSNTYWMNYIGPYVAKAKFGFDASTAADKAEAWDTVVWGCSEWQGRAGNPYATTTDTGYGMNSQFWQNADSTTSTPVGEQAMRWTGTMQGKYWKLGSVKSAAERLLVGDSVIWWLYGRRTTGAGGEASLPGQPIDANAINASKVGTAGLLDYDMYRHSKKPSVANGQYWDKTGAKVAANAVYVDGHAETITGWEQAYRSIFIKTP
jgi:prepilin-type N-terminal cleavage/methylation domain-containing protein/prepilin-type processing-associated H-X9-DG protein